ncbi:methionyl-tRNA synthetase, mitochondrial isoform X2 [Cotesia typhae]|uniref:methionyl-tRNA synthetase, mitochondrial isoform X2 n=1 Tax=Cotesia typhae TaxID=2053667 RepID=UPI003D693A6C
MIKILSLRLLNSSLGNNNLLYKNIMTSSAVRAKKFLEGLKDNPYFDKYAGAIAKLQQTNPDEFISRIEETEKKKRPSKSKESAAAKFNRDASAKPSLGSLDLKQTKVSRLSDVMKLELLEDKANRLMTPLLRSVSNNNHRQAKSWINKTFTRTYVDYCPKNVYLTTPIFYVNAGPHIGHLYTASLADAFARFNIMLGHQVFLSTGTDEHGTKVSDAANANNLSPQNYTDKISGLFKDMCDNFDISYSNFIRTTDLRHHEAVNHFWTTLKENGHLYLGKYSGWYCVSDEAFVSESELLEKVLNGKTIKVSAASGNLVQWMEEDNYKFKLGSMQDDLKYWLKNVKAVEPIKFHKILLSWIEEGSCLEDFSVSRPVSRAPWGIKVPNDNSHTIYVWLDALISYLTSLGYPKNQEFAKFWPPTVQIIGKDILKFHGVYWPAFSMAAGLDPPRTLLCHSHWTVDDEKMSKSKGNVVSPSEAAKLFTADGLRYFLLREAVPHSDANTLGNLVSRCMGKALNPDKIIPEPCVHHAETLASDEALRLVESLENVSSIAYDYYNDYNLHLVVDIVMQSLFLANKMIDHHKPWVLAKETENLQAEEKLDSVLALGLEAARIGSLILTPIIPRLTYHLLDFLNVPSNARMWDNSKYLNTGRNNNQINPPKQQDYAFFKKLR